MRLAYKNAEDKARWRKAYNAANRDKIREWNRAARQRRREGKPSPRKPAMFDAKAYHRKNIDRIRPQMKRAKNVKIRRFRELIREKKSVPCADCKIQFPHYVMDFDHLPEHKKSFTISKIKGSWSSKRLLAEIAKCEVVCSNCHRARTWERKQFMRKGAPDAAPTPEPTTGQMRLFA